MFSIIILALIIFLSWKLAPRENPKHIVKHGAGQIGLLAAVALFGVDYYTSFYYATGELMSALHPLGLQNKAYFAVAIVAFANIVLGALYMFSLGIFNEGGGSYTASMRYLWPTLSLVVAVTLIQDYVLTIVVSALSGGDQLLSILNVYGRHWEWHFLIGAALATITWYLTIRGRGESAKVVFTLLGTFVLLTGIMAGGLMYAKINGVSALPETVHEPVSVWTAIFHIIVAAMKGMVALTGLEAVSNGIQFMIHEDPAIVKWGKKHIPQLKGLWKFYSGKAGIARFVQTSFLFYGGLGTLFLSYFSIHFNVFDGTLGRTLVGNLAFIGFSEIPSGIILYWAYQILAVLLLAAASMTAFQDAQATEWRDVAIGVVPEAIIKRDAKGTFTRSVTFTYIIAVVIMFLVRGKTTVAIPFYGIGVFMPITVMALSIRKHILINYKGQLRFIYSIAASFAAAIAFIIFLLQIVAKWHEGGWIALIAFTILAIVAHLVLISPTGNRSPSQILRIVRQKARVSGKMGNIVEWQAFRMQMYRLQLLIASSAVFAHFGFRKHTKAESLDFLQKKPDNAGSLITISGESSSGVSLILYHLYNEMNSKGSSELMPIILQNKRAAFNFSVLMLVQSNSEAKHLSRLAAALAKRRNGQIYAVHAIAIPSRIAPARVMESLQNGKPLLEIATRVCNDTKVPIMTSMHLGTTFKKAVKNIVFQVKADMLLLKAPYHPNNVPKLFGKDIDNLLHNPPADLALVYFKGALPHIKRILVPTTGSDNAWLAADIAISIAKSSATKVVIELIYVADKRKSLDNEMIKGKTYLESTIKSFDYKMSPKIVASDNVVQALIDEAKYFDMIILGATHETFFENILTGSVAEHIARECNIPIIIARRKSPAMKAVLKDRVLELPEPYTKNPQKRLLRKAF